MKKRSSLLAIALMPAIVMSTHVAFAQTLAAKIAAAPDRSVQFTYPVRPGVCGDGRDLSRRDDIRCRRFERREPGERKGTGR